jgi:rubrerythrin
MLFKAASLAESFHAKKHTTVLEKLGEKMGPVEPKFDVKSTKENLQAAIEGESHEVTSMYPGFISTAKAEMKDEAVTTFEYANTVEKIHLNLYKAALAALEKKDFKDLSSTFAVCPICGNTFDKNIPANCRICGEAKANFVAVK